MAWSLPLDARPANEAIDVVVDLHNPLPLGTRCRCETALLKGMEPDDGEGKGRGRIRGAGVEFMKRPKGRGVTRGHGDIHFRPNGRLGHGRGITIILNHKLLLRMVVDEEVGLGRGSSTILRCDTHERGRTGRSDGYRSVGFE